VARSTYEVIGFSSFGGLAYYTIANAAAFTQPIDQRCWPPRANAPGLVGCLVHAATLPWQSVIAGVLGRAGVNCSRD
jgi:APA family basic amino acid/polyamine antiporter